MDCSSLAYSKRCFPSIYFVDIIFRRLFVRLITSACKVIQRPYVNRAYAIIGHVKAYAERPAHLALDNITLIYALCVNSSIGTTSFFGYPKIRLAVANSLS